MRGILRTVLVATAALGAAVASFLLLSLPPRSVRVDAVMSGTAAATGAYHIHTVRSDGTGTIPEIALAAAQADLQFLIFTDHGDGTRVPDPPAYHHGVLCIDAVEIGTDDGHVVALGLSRASPYRLAGRARDVIADVHRMGGVAVVAHPDSPKADLRWTAPAAEYDGLEWINADSEWRDERPRDLVAAGLRALLRPAESIATLFTRPARTLRRWDLAARSRPVFGLAAIDAHARISWRDDHEPSGWIALARPSYRTMFETLVQTVLLDGPLTGRADEDAQRVLDAVLAGRSYSTARALAWPASLRFSATSGDLVIPMGGRLPEHMGETGVTFTASVPEAVGARLTLLRDGSTIAVGQGELVHRSAAGEAGVYRLEAALSGVPVPWIVSNPIVVGNRTEPEGGPQPSGPPSDWSDVSSDRWTVESDPDSSGTLDSDGESVRLEYALAGGAPRGQYVALVAPVDELEGVDRVTFSGQSDRPARVSIQVRLRGAQEGRRWRTSVYLDETARTITLPLQEFEPADGATSRRPIVTPLHSLLFVLDTVNTAPGAGGQIRISDVRLGLNRPSD